MKLKNIIYKVLLASVVLGCSETADEQQIAEGYMDLRVSLDTSVEDVAVTKSSGDIPEIAVRIVSEKGKTVFQCADISSVEGPVTLKAGDYHVYASSGSDAGVAAFDSPFYTGQAEIQLRAFTVTPVNIRCELAGVMTTVSFAQEIKDNFEYSLVVDNGSGFLTYDASNEDREGYFSATGELNWTLTLENAKGEKFVIEDSYSEVKAKEHYAFAFSLETVEDDSYGAGDFRIKLDDSLNETYHTPTIWINEDGPSISGNDTYEVYVSDLASDVLYRVQSTRQFDKVLITHSDSRLLQCGLPYSSELVAGESVSSFTASSGIEVKVSDDSGTELGTIGTDARYVDFDFTAFVNALPVGEYSVMIFAENQSGLSVEKSITFTINPCLCLEKVVPWAEFIFVKGAWVSEVIPSDFKVQYRLSSESVWTDFLPSVSTQLVINQDNKTVKAFVCGLSPESVYQIRLVSADEKTEMSEAVTEMSAQIYNSNFDNWYQSGKTWYPYAQDASTSAERAWDSANKGVTTITDSNTVPSSASGECVKGNSVKMTTIWVSAAGVTKLASGNLFTGKFNGLVGMSGADLTWGIEFEHRPLGYKGYYRYDAVNINRTGEGYESFSGQPDHGQIQVILQDAGQPYFVVPTTYNGTSVNGPTLDRRTYCDLNTHSTVVARGVLNCDDTGGKFVEVVLPLTYRSITRIPSHGIATFASSYMGDYFTGGEGSVMWADEFEFVYDPLELPADARDSFFALFD